MQMTQPFSRNSSTWPRDCMSSLKTRKVVALGGNPWLCEEYVNRSIKRSRDNVAALSAGAPHGGHGPATLLSFLPQRVPTYGYVNRDCGGWYISYFSANQHTLCGQWSMHPYYAEMLGSGLHTESSNVRSQLNGSHGEFTEGDDMISLHSSVGALRNAENKRNHKAAESHKQSSNSGVKKHAPKLCFKHFSAEGCCDVDCPFSHVRKTTACEHYMFGRCNRGDHCAYAHPPAPVVQDLPLVPISPVEPPDVEVGKQNRDPEPVDPAFEIVRCPTFDRTHTLMDTDLTSLVVAWFKVAVSFYLLECLFMGYDFLYVTDMIPTVLTVNYRWVGVLHSTQVRSDLWYQIPLYAFLYYRYCLISMVMYLRQALFVWGVLRLPVCRRLFLEAREGVTLSRVRERFGEYLEHVDHNRWLTFAFFLVLFFVHQSFLLSMVVLLCAIWYTLERDTSSCDLEFDTPVYVKVNTDELARSVKIGAGLVQSMRVSRTLAELLLSANVSADGRNRGIISRLLFDAERLKVANGFSGLITHEELVHTVHYVAMRLTMTRSYLFESLDGTVSVPIKKFT